MKTWELHIEANGISQEDAVKQASRLLTQMLLGKHTRGYSCGDMVSRAAGNWREITTEPNGNAG